MRGHQARTLRIYLTEMRDCLRLDSLVGIQEPTREVHYVKETKLAWPVALHLED
jgi:hypothetical protein